MIRELKLICGECQQEFSADGKLYYRDNFRSAKISDAFLLCPACIDNWENKWRIEAAVFLKGLFVIRYIFLNDGSIYEALDCTPMDGIVVTNEEIPLKAQQKLFDIYQNWDSERRKIH